MIDSQKLDSLYRRCRENQKKAEIKSRNVSWNGQIETARYTGYYEGQANAWNQTASWIDQLRNNFGYDYYYESSIKDYRNEE